MINARHLLAIAVWVAASCAPATQYPATPAYNRYTLEEIIQWSKAGESPDHIIAKLETAHGFYPLTAKDIVQLHDKGLPVAVLDYLLDTYVRRVRIEERFQLPGRFGSQ
jgi:pyruvate/2-oxoacid:ferredoxin oxidoreductase alpha subunit